ncbi:hypothetical protein [Chryseobacterium sp. ISL-6]|nr:hypothetical protein [Chryseobacterium sp. ISL-6]
MNEKKKQVLKKASIRKYLYAFLLFSLDYFSTSKKKWTSQEH